MVKVPSEILSTLAVQNWFGISGLKNPFSHDISARIFFTALLLLFFLSLLFLLFWVFYKFIFLRDPERRIPAGSSIVAPADGRIIKIVRLKIRLNSSSLKIKKGVIGRIKASAPPNCRDGWLITIMMNLFNVHVQRAPIGGIVRGVKHSSGSFKNAVYGNIFENGLSNEKNEITIENNKIGRIKVIQIAGFIARRIECFVGENQKVNKGGRLGRITLGSQVSLILPKNVKLIAEEGSKVKGGETILAKM